MRSILVLTLIAASMAVHADVTWVQETSPGTGIVTNRGYVTTDVGGGYTRVQPTQSGIVDTSRPGYLVGPTLGDTGSMTAPVRRARTYDKYGE